MQTGILMSKYNEDTTPDRTRNIPALQALLTTLHLLLPDQ